MVKPRILSVGQCAYDHASLSRHLGRQLDADVVGAATFAEAREKLRTGSFDLVLINRVSDRDGARGIELIRTLKADPALAALPVMLVSDYPEAQAEAVALGALPGFGKSGLHDPKTVQALQSALAPEVR